MLRALEESSALSTAELQRAAGSPALSTLRGHLRPLEALGLLERLRRGSASDSAYFELTTAGFEFLEDAEALTAWLARASNGEMEIGTAAAKGAIKALAQGWSAGLVQAFASRALSMIELAEAIELNYPAAERRMRAMRAAGLLEEAPGGRARAYQPSKWLRLAVGPIVFAARREQLSSMPETQPLTQADMAAALLLVTPLLRMSRATGSGSCRLAVETSSGRGRSSAVGLTVEVGRGQVVSSASGLGEGADASASGTAAEWSWALTENDPAQLKIGGDKSLARATVAGMHRLLLGQ